MGEKLLLLRWVNSSNHSLSSTPKIRQKSPSVGDRIEVYWPNNRKYYAGTVKSVDEEKNEHHVKYDDGDEEKLALTKEVWRPHLERPQSIRFLRSLNE